MKKILVLSAFLVLSLGSFAYEKNYDDVKDIVLTEYPMAKISKIEMDKFKGKAVYDVELYDYQNEKKVELVVDANTGIVLKNEAEYDDGIMAKNDFPVSFEDAKNIALDNSFNGTVTNIELKTKNKKSFYLVEVSEETIERELKIDANTGDVLSIKEETR